MKRLLILSLLLSGGLVQMPTSASSHDRSWCYELWEEASRDGIDTMDKIQLIDMGCSKFLSPDNTRWVDSSKSGSFSTASSSSYNPESWCVRSSGVTKERFQRCVVNGGLAYSKRSDAKNIWRHQFDSTSYASSSTTNPMVWCARTSGVTEEDRSACESSSGAGYVYRADANREYWRLKSDTSTSTASSSSYNPESWCVRSSGVTKERFQRCVVNGGLAYSKRSDAKNIWRHQFGSTSYASLTIRSNVRGDRVYIDGKYKGSTRLDLDLPKGRHTVRIEKEGYKTYEEEIDLSNALTLRASLERIAKNSIQTLLETNKCPGCDLTGADLTGADLTGADLTGADLQNAKLAGADLRDANVMNANFHMARFCNTTMPDGSKENLDCRD